MDQLSNLGDVQELIADAIRATNKLGGALAEAILTAQRSTTQEAAETVNQASGGPSTVAPWNPNPGLEGRVTLAEAVGQALGTASMAWDPLPAAVFDSQEAVRVYEGIMAWLSDWRDEQVKEANEATARKIVAMLEQDRDRRTHSISAIIGMNRCIALIEEGLE